MLYNKLYTALQKRFRRTGLIIMYHRINNPKIDPWQLAVSEDNFEQHLIHLSKHYNVIPLSVLSQQVQKKTLKRKTIAITFDDGYVDNFLVAKPLLEKYKLPATFFIAHCNIGLNKAFWWDELVDLIFHNPELPHVFKFSFKGKYLEFELREEVRLSEDFKKKHQKYIAFEPVTLRSQLYFKLWQILSPMSKEDQEEAMGIIRNWAGFTPIRVNEEYLSMNMEQLKKLAITPLFEIGGHTENHPALGLHTKAFQKNEIKTNQTYLEKLSGKKIKLFAYPSGNYNADTVELMKECHFKAAVTTNHGVTLRGDDPYLLKRIQVNNWGIETFSQMIKDNL